MDLLLMDVVANLSKGVDVSNLKILFKNRQFTYEVTEVVSEDLLRYRRSDLIRHSPGSGSNPNIQQTHVMKRTDTFAVKVSAMKLAPPTLSCKSVLTMEIMF